MDEPERLELLDAAIPTSSAPWSLPFGQSGLPARLRRCLHVTPSHLITSCFRSSWTPPPEGSLPLGLLGSLCASAWSRCRIHWRCSRRRADRLRGYVWWVIRISPTLIRKRVGPCRGKAMWFPCAVVRNIFWIYAPRRWRAFLKWKFGAVQTNRRQTTDLPLSARSPDCYCVSAW